MRLLAGHSRIWKALRGLCSPDRCCILRQLPMPGFLERIGSIPAQKALNTGILISWLAQGAQPFHVERLTRWFALQEKTNGGLRSVATANIGSCSVTTANEGFCSSKPLDIGRGAFHRVPMGPGRTGPSKLASHRHKAPPTFPGCRGESPSERNPHKRTSTNYGLVLGSAPELAAGGVQTQSPLKPYANPVAGSA